MTDVLLDARDVETGYTAAVIGPVSFHIDAGEVLGLVGPNGSGKSTLLRAIADDARLFGGDIARKPGIRIAWMEQQPVRLPEMPFNGWEYLRFAGADREAPPPQMTDWLEQRIDSLSGGQFQLLRCWTALGGDAELVMLDEPTNNLDVDSEQTLETILGAGQAERGILLVSHDRAFLERVCSRVMDIHE